MKTNLTELRTLLAEELRRTGNEAIAQGVEQCHDNNAVAVAALRAMQRMHSKGGGVRPARRECVYAIIDGERDYQEAKRAAKGYTQEPDHEIAAFITFMDDYLTEAKHIVSRDWTGCASRTLDTIRKVVALGVACMEAHGAPIRTVK